MRYFEDVAVGERLPATEHGPLSTSQIVRFSTSVETFYPLHHDADWVRERGMPGILVAGPFKHALVTSAVTQWAGPESFVRETECSHRGVDYPGHALTTAGEVTRTWEEDGLGHVECAITLTNDQGQVTCTGRIIVVLPRRDGGHVLKVYQAPEDLYAWAFEDAEPSS